MSKSLLLACLTVGALAASGQDTSTSPSSQNPGSTEPSATGNESPPQSAAGSTNSGNKPGETAGAENKKRISGSRKRRQRGFVAGTQPSATGETRRIVIHRGGVSEPSSQLVPGMSAEESDRAKQATQDLLSAADSDLKQLASRNLSPSQQETVSQIQLYMKVAHSALQEGDIQRAHTLARKAQLLSDDLVRH